MSNLFKASSFNAGVTENGAVTHTSTGYEVLDFFSNMGAMRKNTSGFDELFQKALYRDPDMTLRAVQYLRDVRGGIGERNLFRIALKHLAYTDCQLAERIMVKIPEIGRWDDVLTLLDTPLKDKALEFIVKGLSDESQRGLVAKWMPHNSRDKNFNMIRKFLRLTPKELRHMFRDYAQVVEQDISKGDLSNVDFSKLPSQASRRYQKLFAKIGGTRYVEYVDGLKSGLTSIKSTTLTPADVLRAVRHGDHVVAQEQWKVLPDYMCGSEENILCMPDVSGSMECEVFGSVNALDIGVSLSLYCAERNHGIFKDKILAYSTDPFFIDVGHNNTLKSKMDTVEEHVEYGSTNLHRAFCKIVQLALEHKLSQDDLPTKVIVFSDMEFDSVFGLSAMNNSDAIHQLFTNHGYKPPQIVYWKLSARNTKNYVARDASNGVALVSGFSAATLKSVLGSEDLTPLGVMNKALMTDRYTF